MICHKPTRGVDLGAVELIHENLLALRNRGVSILLLSHDLDELIQLSDRMYVLFGGEIISEFARHEFDELKIGRAMSGVNT